MIGLTKVLGDEPWFFQGLERVHSYKRSGTLTYLLTKGERNLLSAGLRWHLVTLYGSAGSAVREQFIAQTLVKPNIFNEMFVKPLKKQKKNKKKQF